MQLQGVDIGLTSRADKHRIDEENSIQLNTLYEEILSWRERLSIKVNH